MGEAGNQTWDERPRGRDGAHARPRGPQSVPRRTPSPSRLLPLSFPILDPDDEEQGARYEEGRRGWLAWWEADNRPGLPC